MQSTNYKLYIFILSLITAHLSYSINANAQFISATLGINGLTCSLCSYNVERELEKIDAIKTVEMDLNLNIAKIIFKESVPVQMKDVINAVYKAGFSVGYTQALFSLNDVSIRNDTTFNYQNNKYKLVDSNTIPSSGSVILKFVDKKFVAQKESKHWKKKFKSEKDLTVYHITL